MVISYPSSRLHLSRTPYLADESNCISVRICFQDAQCLAETSSGENVTPYTDTEALSETGPSGRCHSFKASDQHSLAQCTENKKTKKKKAA